ncbi:MAG: hypothetical protein EOM52_09640 [Clostridia bacterium]|nr:hypothetical protein [Clostridia bacterium]
MSDLINSAAYAQQMAMNADLEANFPYKKTGRAEKSALRRAKEAEMRFRIEKGYEKDSFWTHFKYRFLKRN